MKPLTLEPTAPNDSATRADASCRFACLLTPLDNLQFRDGRPLEAGFLHNGQLPTPQTLTGALRVALLTHFGCDIRDLDKHIQSRKGGVTSGLTSEAAFRIAVSKCFPGFEWIADLNFRGPWLMQRYPTRWKRSDEFMLPLPANLQRSERRGQWSVLEPLSDNDCTSMKIWNKDSQSLRPLWSHVTEPAEPVEGFIRPAALQRYLERSRGVTLFEDFANDRDQQEWFVHRDELVRDDSAVGIRRDLDRNSVIKGGIYAPCELAFPSGLDENGLSCPRTVFYVELEWSPTSDPDTNKEVLKNVRKFLGKAGHVGFGGRGHEVAIEETAVNSASQRTAVDGDRILVLATTPVLADNPSAPKALVDTRVQVVSASIPRSFPVSGWDAARRCPQPTRFAAAAGSVYFVELTGSNDEKQTQRQAIQNLRSLSEAPDSQYGWGSFVTGTWNSVRLI